METLKTSYISGRNFQNSKIITFLILQKLKLSCCNLAASLKKHYISGSKFKVPKTIKKFAPEKVFVSCDVFVILTTVKQREIPCDYLYNSKA